MIALTTYAGDDTFYVNPRHVVACFVHEDNRDYTDIVVVTGETYTTREAIATVQSRLTRALDTGA